MDNLPLVMRGLDPRIHPSSKEDGCRVTSASTRVFDALCPAMTATNTGEGRDSISRTSCRRGGISHALCCGRDRATLSDAADHARRSLRARRARRFSRPPHRPEDERRLGPANRRRQSAGREHHHRRPGGRQGQPRRLHAADGDRRHAGHEQEKAKPGTFQIGISTPTSQVNVGLLNMMAGTNFTMVPYRGGTTQITGILAGDIALGMESINVSLPLWRDKKLKILGLVSAQRLSLAPDIPTIAETFPGYDLGIWQSIVAPAGTPRDVVVKLHGSIRKVLALPEVREKLLNAGIEPASSNTPEEFAAFIRSQADTRAKVIQAVGMKLD